MAVTDFVFELKREESESVFFFPAFQTKRIKDESVNKGNLGLLRDNFD